jgi:hypothetical protein
MGAMPLTIFLITVTLDAAILLAPVKYNKIDLQAACMNLIVYGTHMQWLAIQHDIIN